MRFHGVIAIIAGMLVWGASLAQAQPVSVTLASGNLGFQFADGNPKLPDGTTTNPNFGHTISSLSIPLGGTSQVQVYLLQTGGQVAALPAGTGLFQTLGSESLGVRLVYNNPSGITRVPSTALANMVANAGFDFIQRSGSPPAVNPPNGSGASGLTTDTTTNAALVESLLGNPVVFPGAEDPLGAASNAVRILIGTFTLSGVAQGTTPLIAEDPFTIGNNNLTGPNPTSGNPDGAHGEIMLDQYLTDYKTTPQFATLNVTVGVPEPGTMALGGLAAAGLAAWRRRRGIALAV